MVNSADICLSSLRSAVLGTDQRFSHYQSLPSKIKKLLSIDTGSYVPRQIPLDEARLSFMMARVEMNEKKVTEIGSNLGYFCIEIADRVNAEVIGYEPIEAYAKVCNEMSFALRMYPRMKFLNQSICLGDIGKLEPADICIELNVLHHAGVLYDQEVLTSLGGWRKYAVRHLRELRQKFSKLIFQTGNMHSTEKLYENEVALDFEGQLLEEAGWRVDCVGVADLDSAKALYYRGFSKDLYLAEAPRYRCRRTADGRAVSYTNVKTGQVTEMLTGLGSRPLWLCS